MEKGKINDYLKELNIKLQNSEVVTRSFADISNFPLATGQCIYIVDFKKREVTFQHGITEFLGYRPEEFTFNHVVNSYHPNDYEMVIRLMKAILQYASENNMSGDVGYFVTCRIPCKDGSYVKVLRQSNVYDLDEGGKIISNVSLITDISFIDTTERVQWKFDAPGLDQKKFKEYVTKEYADFFSERELDVLKLLKNGITSQCISEKLFISKHTVDGHRRKMLYKSHCTNTIDLINFSKTNGLL
ncbi:MAG: LuxR C-terminal-related transcriptional regulator [Bacteroidota bacterium]|nr:LuxR C-terminal-related transcriptional regulator [Bacteroidota bacterium]